jgi:zinc transporter ZupT
MPVSVSSLAILSSITAVMVFFTALPWISTTIHEHSTRFFLIGTGAMVSLCCFDLLPEIFEVGGNASLVLMAVSLGLYSAAHIFHLGHHHHPGESPAVHLAEEAGFSGLFLASMMAHCFASGVLLAVSGELSSGLANTVFWALVAHKAFEAFTVSALFLKKKFLTRSAILASLTAYVLSLPVGFAAAQFFHSEMTRSIALVASSIAAGTLAGCLIFDFLLPSFQQLRGRHRLEFGWIVLGSVLTQMLLRGL